MKIIKANLADLNSIYELNKQLHIPIRDFRWDKKYWIKQEIKYGSFYVVKNNIIHGAMCLQLNMENKKEAYIETLAIKKNKQKKGLGTKLVNFAIKKAKENKKNILTVGSLCESNAEDFYLKCGFTLEDELGDYYGHEFYGFYLKL